ncbi:MAG: YdcF family protein [Mycobacteriaceae bacterium]|uniref:YdcF family protein n=1 Tax=Corynebacterium sp. TaxID=1720 RepID=UPI003F9E9551
MDFPSHSPNPSRANRGRHRAASTSRPLRRAAVTVASAAVLAGGLAGTGSAAAAPALPDLPATKDLLNDNRTIVDHELVRTPATHAVLARDASAPIVVLGARLQEDCAPPGILDDRLNGAATLANIHRANPIVVTGGVTQPDCPSEGQAMETGLRARGVTNPVIVEDKAGSTVENAANTSEFIDGNGGAAVIVTSDPHYIRALDNYRSEGVEAVAYVEGEG